MCFLQIITLRAKNDKPKLGTIQTHGPCRLFTNALGNEFPYLIYPGMHFPSWVRITPKVSSPEHAGITNAITMVHWKRISSHRMG